MTWEKKRVTVVTKAYPEKSTRHGSVACTAGITEEGDWIRLYPIDIRHFIGDNKTSKYDVIEVEVKPDKDKLGRRESYKVRPETIKIIDKTLTKPKINWERRNKIILPKLNASLSELKDSYSENKTSLGLIKPSEIIDFIKTEDLEIFETSGWSFTINLDGKTIPNVTQIPHVFKYRFKCAGCKKGEHSMQCEDWELFESYRSWGPRYGDPEKLWNKLRERYLNWMLEKRDLHYIMGMYSRYPTWFIIGLYYPPKGRTGQ